MFHDAGTYNSATLAGGLDSSLLSFLEEKENGGIKESIVSRFLPNIGIIISLSIGARISNSDAIALGALVTIQHCGGPTIPFLYGRKDTTTPTSPVGRLPAADEAFPLIMDKLIKNGINIFYIGFDYIDIVVLVSGSHSMGGIHRDISPELFLNVDTSIKYIPFDNTPGIFDNDIFKRTLEGRCPLPFDCEIARDPIMKPMVERYAKDQNAFFIQYGISFTKMSRFTSSTLTREINVVTSVHPKLEMEGIVNYTGTSYQDPLSGSPYPSSKSSSTDTFARLPFWFLVIYILFKVNK
jgi:hypothetical protein